MKASHPAGSNASGGLAAVLTFAVVLQGLYSDSQLALGCAALAVLIVTFRATAMPRPALIAFIALGLTLLLSAAINGFPSQSLKPALTLVFSAGVFMLAFRAASVGGVGAALDAIVLPAVVAAVTGLIGVALHLERFAFESNGWRLSSTLTYQNAAACLFAVAVPTALTRASSGSAVHRSAVAILTAGVVATQSRAGMLAWLVAVTIWMFHQRDLRTLILSITGTLVITLGLQRAISGDAGWSSMLAIGGIGAGIWVAASDIPARYLRRATAITLAFAMVTTIAGLAVARRITEPSNERLTNWSRTIDQIAEHPLVGTGPGTFRLETESRSQPVIVIHAHNEYLQVASETGVVGLAGVMVAIGMLAYAVWRRRRQAAAVAAIASGGAFLLHSGLDFVWRIPALPAFAFALVAIALAQDPLQPDSPLPDHPFSGTSD